MNNKNIIEKAEEYVFELFKENLSPKFVYHNFRHSEATARAADEIGREEGLSDDEMKIVLLAAWFHDTGYLKKYEGHEEESMKIAEEFLKQNNYPQEKLKQVLKCIDATKFDREPENKMEEVLLDADLLNIGKKSFFSVGELLRVEWEIFLNKFYSNVEWAEHQLDFLMKTNFYTHYAQENYEKKRSENITEQQKILRKKVKKAKKKAEKKKEKKFKEKDPKRGKETLFRTNYRNHINLSSIADTKANMMISINAIILSIIITIVGSNFSIGIGSIGSDNVDISQRFVLPSGILLITCLISMIFAILSAQPKVTSKNIDIHKLKNREGSLLFFGNFTNISLSEFEEGMEEIMSDQKLLYGSMTKDIYFLGKVLTKKYRLLYISYVIFMIGITITVLAFILIFLRQT